MRRRWAAVGLVAVLVAGSGAAYGVASGESDPPYRTVQATTGDVEQTLASSGSVDAANRADLGFGTDGTIAALKVAVGDVVKAGQVLAVLETTDLDAAVTDAKASVAQAVAQLAADREAQNAAVEEAVTQPETGTDEPAVNDDTAKTLRALARLQDAVLKAQQQASAALALARSALTTQTEVCAAANEASENAAAEEEVAAEEAAAEGEADPCATSLAAVQERQQQVSDAQDQLAAALQDLVDALTRALGSVGSTTPTQPSAARKDAADAADTTADAADTAAGSGPQSGGSTITAARLAADQAQIEQARAELVTAQQARAQAKLLATRSGKVADLGAGVGDSVAAGDTVATVIGGKAVTVQGSVTEEKVDQVKVGQLVRVTVPGSDDAAEGRVTAVGMVADTSSGTSSYPVTVTVEDPSIPLPTGSSALLEIVLSTATDVVTVPTSAVSGEDGRYTVRVRQGSGVSSEQVTLGVVGSTRVEITDGLEAGDEVVVAAIDDPIDGASSELNERGGFGPNAPMIEFRGGPGGSGGPRTFSSGP